MGRGRGAECVGEMGLARLLSLGTYALPTWATWHRLHEKRTQTRVVMARWLPETTVALGPCLGLILSLDGIMSINISHEMISCIQQGLQARAQ